MRLHAEHKARLARFEAAAARHVSMQFFKSEQEPKTPPLPPIADAQIEEAHEILHRCGLINKVDIVQRAVLTKFPDVTLHDLRSNRRTAKVVTPRQIAMYLCREMTNKSLPDIGRRFGGRDHTTVLHAVNKVTGRMIDDPDFARLVNSIREII
jgi:chromosomal replication initiation ATPase DnaA